MLHNTEFPTITAPDGFEVWYKHGKIHRDGDLPAVTDVHNDTILWVKNGEIHRDNDLPAVIDAEIHFEWCQHGKLHRDNDLPASIYGSTIEWYQHGKRHRANGPAVTNEWGGEAWLINDELHRDDGPAIIWDQTAELSEMLNIPSQMAGTKEWYQHGVRTKIELPENPLIPNPNTTCFDDIEQDDVAIQSFLANDTYNNFVLKMNDQYSCNSLEYIKQLPTFNKTFIECNDDAPPKWQGNTYARHVKPGGRVFVKLLFKGVNLLVLKPDWIFKNGPVPAPGIFELVPLDAPVLKFVTSDLVPNIVDGFSALGADHCNQKKKTTSIHINTS